MAKKRQFKKWKEIDERNEKVAVMYDKRLDHRSKGFLFTFIFLIIFYFITGSVF